MGETILINIFCIMIVFVMLFATLIQEERKNAVNQAFIGLLLSVLLFQALDFWSELLDGRPQFTLGIKLTSLFAFFAIDVIFAAFCAYLYQLIRERHGNAKSLRVVLITCSVRILVTLILAVTDNLFIVENGIYTEKEWVEIPYIIFAIVIVELILIVIRNRKIFAKLEFAVVLIYLIFPVFPVVLEMIIDLYSLTVCALTFSIFLVYVLMQARIVNTEKAREEALEDISKTDFLTGLKNRRSYYESVGEIGQRADVGVMFCDLNRLKYVNDHFGHVAGDELIQEFGRLLVSVLGEERVFRISGDEFVAVCQNVSVQEFSGLTNSVKQKIAEKDEIAALGTAFGKGCCVEKLVSEAEEIMYENKRAYHQRLKENEKG